MKTKRKTPTEPTVRHTVSSQSVAPALHKARVPNRFVRPEVTLKAFNWGARMKAWIGTSVAECRKRGQCLFLVGDASQAIEACAMLVRTLVVRGHDAVFITLPELLEMDEPLRISEFIVIAGFYDHTFHKTKGCPMTTAESYKLSWALWRAASEGATIIAFTTPPASSVSNWWVNGALDALFNKGETLTLTPDSQLS